MHESPWIKTKVLIVDDDPDLRDIYSVKFIAENFDVSLASDGEEALQMMRSDEPDIVLLDIQMPKKNGFEVLKEMRNDPVLLKMPVIVLSNVDEEDAFKKAGELETRFYIVKSLATPQKVVDLTREALAQER